MAVSHKTQKKPFYFPVIPDNSSDLLRSCMTLVALLFSTKHFFDIIDHVSCYRSCLLNKRRKCKTDGETIDLYKINKYESNTYMWFIWESLKIKCYFWTTLYRNCSLAWKLLLTYKKKWDMIHVQVHVNLFLYLWV